MLYGLKSFYVTSSVSSITCAPWSDALASSPLDYRAAGGFWSSFFLQTFLCFEVNFKIGSPGTLTAVCVGGEGLGEHSSSFSLWKSSGHVPGARLAKTELNQEERGNWDMWPNKNQLAFALGFPTSCWFKPEPSFSFSGTCSRLLLFVRLFCRLCSGNNLIQHT